MQAILNDTQTHPPMVELIRGPYLVGGRECVTDEVATRVVKSMRSAPDEVPRGVLAGRGHTGIRVVEGLGRTFVKQYAHGGILRAVTGGWFLGVGESRSRKEFDMLERVRALGVLAPKPYVYVNKGSLFYQTWLLMEEIQDSRNLAEISMSGDREDADIIHEAMSKLGEQVLMLVAHKILHVDLHPGNVLVNGKGQVFLVDFDKAHVFQGAGEALRELYLRRWRRAVIKHRLSPVLTELMSLTLRSYHE